MSFRMNRVVIRSPYGWTSEAKPQSERSKSGDVKRDKPSYLVAEPRGVGETCQSNPAGITHEAS
jgi:hypothetical protein